MGETLTAKRILLIVGGGIAAYKALDLIRRLRERGASVRAVMTAAAQQFVTPLSVGALTADHVFTDLFDRQDEQDVGHIRLARDTDLIVAAPATADLMAKLANGHANDLASAVLLATDRPVLMAPAMNPRMWTHPATRRNRATLEKDGVHFVGPGKGEMAERGEAGEVRMAAPLEIVATVEALLDGGDKPLAGRRIIVTSGPTHEPIDPVRYIANRSSGKQGHAIAAALAKLGADVRLVSGPVTIADPAGVATTHVETARQMQAAVEAQLPADAAVFVAAVADWRTAAESGEKIKKVAGEGPPALQMVENPDILAGVGHHPKRPALVVGFAAETQAILKNAEAKLK
jgi:phosphopantothenoylcysteine decarboxylase/phosphopantothenate--cysteine ligase